VKLALELDSESVARGERLTGRVNVVEGGDSRRLTVTLTLHEHSPSYDVVARTTEVALAEGALATGASYDFWFEPAADAWPSVKAKHSELFWQLEAKSDERGLDTHASRRVTVT
jgi:hypothetical protein